MASLNEMAVKQSGNMIGAGLGMPSASANALHQADSLLEDTMALCCRLQGMVDRLCGSQPPTTAGNGSEGIAGMPDGALPRLADRVRTARAYIHGASDALDRLDRELP